MSKNTVNSISDIRDLAARHGMPLERMRFFIGVNNTEPKCFGIYQDDAGYWVVYKNKANGERAVRYRGRSETEASRIIWEKIEDEIKVRKKEKDWWQHQQDLANNPEYADEYEKELEKRVLRPRYSTVRNQKKNVVKPLLISAGIIALIAGVTTGIYHGIRHNRPTSGYYTHDNDLYYYQYPSWYIWDSYVGDWDTYDYDDAYFEDDWQDWNYDGRYYVYEGDDDNYYSFQNSDYYNSHSSSGSSSSYSSSDYDSDWSSDWDSSWDSDDDYDYDYSDWDSSDTDWDSDW